MRRGDRSTGLGWPGYRHGRRMVHRRRLGRHRHRAPPGRRSSTTATTTPYCAWPLSSAPSRSAPALGRADDSVGLCLRPDHRQPGGDQLPRECDSKSTRRHRPSSCTGRTSIRRGARTPYRWWKPCGARGRSAGLDLYSQYVIRQAAAVINWPARPPIDEERVRRAVEQILACLARQLGALTHRPVWRPACPLEGRLRLARDGRELRFRRRTLTWGARAVCWARSGPYSPRWRPSRPRVLPWAPQGAWNCAPSHSVAAPNNPHPLPNPHPPANPHPRPTQGSAHASGDRVDRTAPLHPPRIRVHRPPQCLVQFRRGEYAEEAGPVQDRDPARVVLEHHTELPASAGLPPGPTSSSGGRVTLDGPARRQLSTPTHPCRLSSVPRTTAHRAPCACRRRSPSRRPRPGGRRGCSRSPGSMSVTDSRFSPRSAPTNSAT